MPSWSPSLSLPILHSIPLHGLVPPASQHVSVPLSAFMGYQMHRSGSDFSLLLYLWRLACSVWFLPICTFLWVKGSTLLSLAAWVGWSNTWTPTLPFLLLFVWWLVSDPLIMILQLSHNDDRWYSLILIAAVERGYTAYGFRPQYSL